MATDVAINPDGIQKFFSVLEDQKNRLSVCIQLFQNLTRNFTSLQDLIAKESQDLDAKFETLESNSTQIMESLSQKEASISERESAAASEIEEKKAAGLKEIEEPSDSVVLSEALKSYFRKMDSSGLLHFIISKRKESVQWQEEISKAMVEAVDPLTFVVDAVEEFVGNKIEGYGLIDKRWACSVLVGSLCFDSRYYGREGNVPVVGKRMAERVGNILDNWKAEHVDDEGDNSGGVTNPAEAIMFMQLVTVFGLRSRFGDEFFKNLILENTTRKDMAKAAMFLGLKEQLPEIIDEMIKRGKGIEAVYFVIDAGLTKKYPPESILKSHLDRCKQNAAQIKKVGNSSSNAKEESNKAELMSIRPIIRCVEEHHLESKFPLDGLRRRITQLEKARDDRRKAAVGGPTKPPKKRRAAYGNQDGASRAFRPPKTPRYSTAYPSKETGMPRLPTPLEYQGRYYSYLGEAAYESHASAPHTVYNAPHVDGIGMTPQSGYGLSGGAVGSQVGSTWFDYGYSALSRRLPYGQ